MTPEREISNLRALLTQTLEIKLKLFDAKVEAEKERDQLRGALENWLSSTPTKSDGTYCEINQPQACYALRALEKIREEREK